MTVLTIIAIMVYLTSVGAVFSYWYRFLKGRCYKCSSSSKYHSSDDLHAGPATLTAIFWPVMLPVLMGYGLSEYLSTKESREAKREECKKREHDRKMTELKMERENKQIEADAAMTNIKFLVENGIKADVPGLYDLKGGE